MLFSNRRVRLIFTALTGMEAAALTPWLLLLFSAGLLWRNADALRSIPPLTLFLSLWIGLLGMLLAVDVLSHSKLSDTRYRLAVLGLIAGTALLGVRVLVVDAPLLDLRWLGGTVDALVNFHRGLRPAAIIFLLVIFLWMRGATLSSREINFADVSLSFRFGLLLLLFSGGFVAARLPDGPASAVALIALFLTLGLVAVSLARTDEKAIAAHDQQGGFLSWPRALELLVMVGVTVGLALLLSAFFTPQRLLAILQIFEPVWALLGRLLQVLLYVFAVAAEGVARLLIYLLGPFFTNVDLGAAWEEFGRRLAQTRPDIEEQPPALEEWRYARLLGLFVRVLLVGGFVVGLLWLVYIFLERRRHSQDTSGTEKTSPEAMTFGGNALGRAWDQLKNLAGLVQRYGLGRELLDAVSVENMYANLSRLARERGQPRDPSQPPDAYLPRLRQAFPGQEEALARLTDAYMQVHYGDAPLPPEKIAALRQEYETVRATEAPDA